MSDRIEDYIAETPQWLDRIRQGSAELFAGISEKKFDRIILTGSGTSYHSAIQTEQTIREFTGLAVHSVYPFAVTRELIGDGARTLFVGISQGGGSQSTYDAMNIAQNAGCTIASMSAADDTYIDRLADYRLKVVIGDEFAGAKTKGYYGTKLTLLLLGQAIGRANGTIDEAAAEEFGSRLDSTIARFPEVFERTNAWVSAHLDEFASSQDLRFVGPKSLFGDTLEVALKTLETMRVPVTGYEFDEFIHGIYNAVNDGSYVVFMDDGSIPRMQRMVEVLSEWSDHIYVVANHDAPYVDLNIGDVPADELQTFYFPMTGQLLAALVPWQKGYDPTPPKDPTFHDKLSSKRN
ncbi:MAG: SIS domain-containing protein [Candidatus Microbacterium stercoravium]